MYVPVDELLKTDDKLDIHLENDETDDVYEQMVLRDETELQDINPVVVLLDEHLHMLMLDDEVDEDDILRYTVLQQ